MEPVESQRPAGEILIGALEERAKIDAQEAKMREIVGRFSRSKPYEHWADVLSVLVGLFVFWPFVFMWTLFTLRPELNDSPWALPIVGFFLVASVFSVRHFTEMSSLARRSAIRAGLTRSFKKQGKSVEGDFVGIAYSQRFLVIGRGIDWDYGFLNLTHDNLRFEGERSRFALNPDSIEGTELKAHFSAQHGWFVRLFVTWRGDDDDKPECFNVCFQDQGTRAKAWHAPTAAWKNRIEDWRWNNMSRLSTVTAELPLDSTPIEQSVTRRQSLSLSSRRLAWICSIFCTIAVAGAMVFGMYWFSVDWGGGLVAAVILYMPFFFRTMFGNLFFKLGER